MKTSTDVLALGRYLVRELGYEDRVDTLGRWMAHHLAELIRVAENGPTLKERSKAQADATETILRIWEHRTTLPGKAYPLTAYQDVLQVIDRLRPDDNPFKYFGHHAEARREQFAAVLFDNLTRLIIALLLKRVPPDAGVTDEGKVAVEALDETEQRIFQALQRWAELFKPDDQKPNRAHRRRKSRSQSPVDLDEVAVQLIDNITEILSDLRDEILKEPSTDANLRTHAP